MRSVTFAYQTSSVILILMASTITLPACDGLVALLSSQNGAFRSVKLKLIVATANGLICWRDTVQLTWMGLTSSPN
jgi:hypothetical protein